VFGVKAAREITTEAIRAVNWRKKAEDFDSAGVAICSLLKRLFDYGMTTGLAVTNSVQSLSMRYAHRVGRLRPFPITRFDLLKHNIFLDPRIHIDRL